MIDVVGWFETGAGGARFHPVAPVRTLDTRIAPGACRWRAARTSAPRWPGPRRAWTRAVAVVGNLTVTEAAGPAFITAWPSGEAQPWASVQNTVAGTTRANQAMVKVGTNGQVDVANSAGAVHVIIDVVGYFS
ncbi:MAG: hypothetical protein R2755_30560 [Acidimicrobiales bacterium]